MLCEIRAALGFVPFEHEIVYMKCIYIVEAGQGLPLKAIAAKVGLRTLARLGQAFERRFGMAPSPFREMHEPRAA